jgi:hypothetical protein
MTSVRLRVFSGDSGAVSGFLSGIPYVIKTFAIAGKIPADKDPAMASSLDQDWSGDLFPGVSPRHGQFPLNLGIVDFPQTFPASKHSATARWTSQKKHCPWNVS